MKIEANLQPNEARIVSGVKGAKSKSFTKKFANEAAQDRWLDANGDDCSIFEIARA